MNLILASTSTYRAALLKKLELDFIIASPEVDEHRLIDEPPEIMVRRLSEEKAHAVGRQFSGLIIGSDQCATHTSNVIGKPGNHKNAVQQLSGFSGQAVTFLTGLCLLNTETGNVQSIVEPFTVNFRHLSKQTIETYLEKEKPYDCAGSFKSEGLGICLFSSMQGEDPNSLVGLPLIKLVSFLKNEGITLPQK